MGYCVIQNLVDRFGSQELIQLTDRTHIPATTLDDAVAQRAIDDASAQMDSYFAVRYELPLLSVPPVVASCCADIARFNLYDDKATEEVRARYDDWRAWLLNCSKGLVLLALPATQEPSINGAAFQASPRLFSRESTRDL